jgi:protein SCO1/2
LSHTVDPETDTPNRLKRYAKRRGANLSNWQFVTGTKSELYTQGLKSYLVSTQEDVLAPGGFLHSSLFALIDKQLRLRGVYDGTNPTEIEKLNKDLKILLNEK